MPIRLLVLTVLVSVAIACDRAPSGPTGASAPLAPSAVTSSAMSGGAAAAQVPSGRESVVVNVLDACDPATFAAQQVDCVRSGGVQFDQFIAELTRLGFVGAWHFSPSNANVRVGASFAATNRGGEVHTFTEVAQFGGGIVPPLNQLAHVPVMAPECGALEGDDFIAPGTTYHEEVDHAGTLKFQCCIHPWMRLVAQAR